MNQTVDIGHNGDVEKVLDLWVRLLKSGSKTKCDIFECKMQMDSEKVNIAVE